MTSTNPPRFAPRPRRAMTVGCLVLLLPLLVLLGAAHPSSAAAANTIRPGLGSRIVGGDFVGYYLTARGEKVYCLDPRKAAPRTVSLTEVPRIGGTSATVNAEIAYALGTWGNARTAREAAVESQVVNTLIGNASDVRRRARHLPATVGVEVRAHVLAAQRLHGPYRVELDLRGGAPGQSALGSVRVRAATGRLVPDATIALTGSASVAIPARVRTQTSGVGEFRYTVVGVGEARVTAVAIALPGTDVRIGHPARGQQRMVTWASQTSARTSAAFGQHPNGFTNSYACSSECAGQPQVRLSACAPASGYTSRIEYRVGTSVRVVLYAPSRVRTCHTIVVTLHDRDHVTAVWRYRTAHEWSDPLATPGAFTVDCPAVPQVAASTTTGCAAATVRIALANPAADGNWSPLVNDSQHPTVLVITGATTQRIVALHGLTAMWSATVPCSSPSTYVFRAGVQRSNGTWNYGPVGRLTTA